MNNHTFYDAPPMKNQGFPECFFDFMTTCNELYYQKPDDQQDKAKMLQRMGVAYPAPNPAHGTISMADNSSSDSLLNNLPIFTPCDIPVTHSASSDKDDILTKYKTLLREVDAQINNTPPIRRTLEQIIERNFPRVSAVKPGTFSEKVLFTESPYLGKWNADMTLPELVSLFNTVECDGEPTTSDLTDLTHLGVRNLGPEELKGLPVPSPIENLADAMTTSSCSSKKSLGSPFVQICDSSKSFFKNVPEKLVFPLPDPRLRYDVLLLYEASSSFLFAHKAVLSAASKGFDFLFSEQGNQKNAVVPVPESINADILFSYIKFLYGNGILFISFKNFILCYLLILLTCNKLFLKYYITFLQYKMIVQKWFLF